MDGNIHQRVLKLRDAALGSRKSVSVSSALARVSYECVVDSLLTLYSECSSEQAGLARDKNVARFLSKCRCLWNDCPRYLLVCVSPSQSAEVASRQCAYIHVCFARSGQHTACFSTSVSFRCLLGGCTYTICRYRTGREWLKRTVVLMLSIIGIPAQVIGVGLSF